MSLRGIIWSLVVILFIGVAAFNIRLQFKSAENLEKEQNIEEAFVKFLAPALEKKTLNEKNLKDSLGETAQKVAVYGIFAKQTEYSVFYIQYRQDFDLKQASDNFIKLFADVDFNAEISDDENVITLNGKLARENMTAGIYAAFFKKGKNFWQAFTVFPYSKENEDKAKQFIDSLETDPQNKLQNGI
jgi:preprotein translocase subunit SecF